MEMRKLGRSGLTIAPLVLGGNVFGWTADKKTSFDLLDRFVDAGLNAVDTADAYSRWISGHVGGESETIIGEWLASRKSRDRIVLITKVGSDMGSGRKDLSAAYIARAVEDSLRRLQTDHIDLYFSHWPDPAVSHEETLGAYDKLIKAGKVRAIGCSNYDAELLKAALKAADANGLPHYSVLQPEYNLYNRASFEGPLRDLVLTEDIGVISYYALASGFLSGKYRNADDKGKSARGGAMDKFLNARGFAILGALDAVAQKHGAAQAEVAIAWVRQSRGITAPIASATSLAQLESLIKASSLQLDKEDMAALDAAGAKN